MLGKTHILRYRNGSDNPPSPSGRGDTRPGGLERRFGKNFRRFFCICFCTGNGADGRKTVQKRDKNWKKKLHPHYLAVHQQPRIRGHWQVPVWRSWRKLRCTRDKWPRIAKCKKIRRKGGNRRMVSVCNLLLYLGSSALKRSVQFPETGLQVHLELCMMPAVQSSRFC